MIDSSIFLVTPFGVLYFLDLFGSYENCSPAQLVSSVWTWTAVFSVLVAMWKLPCATMDCLLHIHMPSGKASFFR